MCSLEKEIRTKSLIILVMNKMLMVIRSVFGENDLMIQETLRR
jgi:hypothetical protein